MRTSVATGLAAIALSAAAFADDADTTKDEVLAVIDAFFVAFNAKDADALGALVAPPGHVRSVRAFSETGGFINETPIAEWPAALVASESDLLEVYWDPVVQVRNPLMATVWTPYEIKIDGETSHCGVDHFTLVKRTGGWRIAEVTYTTEPDACEALRPDDLNVVRPAALAPAFLATE